MSRLEVKKFEGPATPLGGLGLNEYVIIFDVFNIRNKRIIE